MKYSYSFIFCLLFTVNCSYGGFNMNLNKEFLWLGYAAHNEKRFGIKSNPYRFRLTDYVHENDSLEMALISELCGVKYKRSRPLKDCSNCDKWFYSKKVNKKWLLSKYYQLSPLYKDDNGFQWYQPYFKEKIILNADSVQQASFITGLFLKNGAIDSLGYQITLKASPTIAAMTAKTLKILRSTNVSHNITLNQTIDGFVWSQVSIIRFKPKNYLQKFLYNLTELASIRH